MFKSIFKDSNEKNNESELFSTSSTNTQHTTKFEKVEMVKDKTDVTCIGIDHGNGFMKAKSDINHFVLPSQIAREEEFSGESYGQKSKRDFKIFQTVLDEGDDQKYAWGRFVNKAKYPIRTYATEERYTKLPYRLLSSFALTELVDPFSDYAEVSIVTGVPSYEKGTSLEEDLRQVFMKTHLINVEGREKRIYVKDVRVVPQPLGTLLQYYLDEEGYVLDNKFESENFYSGIIDIGSGTSDLDGLKELEVVSKDRSTIRKGMFDAYDMIANYIKEQDPRVDIDKERVELWIRKKEQAGEDPYLFNPTRKIEVDFRQAANKAFKNLAEDIIMEIDQRWNKSHFNEIYLTGGGAQTLGKYFKNWDQDIVIVDNHQMANAIGFYRFAKYLQMD